MPHVGVERVVGCGFAELADDLGKPAHVGGRARQPTCVTRLLHQLEKQIAHIELIRRARKTLEQRLQCGRGGSGEGDQVGRIADHAQHRDQIFDLRLVVEAVAAYHHVR